MGILFDRTSELTTQKARRVKTALKAEGGKLSSPTSTDHVSVKSKKPFGILMLTRCLIIDYFESGQIQK